MSGCRNRSGRPPSILWPRVLEEQPASAGGPRSSGVRQAKDLLRARSRPSFPIGGRPEPIGHEPPPLADWPTAEEKGYGCRDDSGAAGRCDPAVLPRKFPRPAAPAYGSIIRQRHRDSWGRRSVFVVCLATGRQPRTTVCTIGVSGEAALCDSALERCTTGKIGDGKIF